MASKAYLIEQSRPSSYASSSISEILVLRTRLRMRFLVASFLHIYAHTGHHNPKFTLSISPVRHYDRDLLRHHSVLCALRCHVNDLGGRVEE
ncbi:hypothetical protein M422DRAFT_39771 [Sphaerobolus stellatus SS14]|uniref:Uncharacterized protein n=1 Tax=Sphaerobolus stellatus (strain SS14) TaxID=990650 RepID=A0A0C9T2T5_SPHS4|nr:hypothetical protein M422DRAFT_39771 [Sphaerobolus stellatus SS14]